LQEINSELTLYIQHDASGVEHNILCKHGYKSAVHQWVSLRMTANFSAVYKFRSRSYKYAKLHGLSRSVIRSPSLPLKSKSVACISHIPNMSCSNACSLDVTPLGMHEAEPQLPDNISHMKSLRLG
jgi:hypothetical protein